MPHMEGEQEIRGLRVWNGQCTVRLLEEDELMGAMLIERCKPGTSLRELAEREQDLVIAKLLETLWSAPAPRVFRSLSALTEYWSKETLADIGRWTDPGLVTEGLGVFQELPRNASTEVLLATDLHAGNVLRAEREPWLVIDPKPFIGDPAYDATQHLLNCKARMLSRPVEMIRRFADLLEVDHERVRLWMFARLAAEPRDEWGDESSAELARALSA